MCYKVFEAGAGIEPAHGGFADRFVTTSTSGRINCYFNIIQTVIDFWVLFGNNEIMRVDKRGGHNQKRINKNFFKEWSPKMAYVLGFIYADGTVENCIKSSRTCYLGITNTNLQILEDIRKCMDSDHIISTVKAGRRNIKGKYYSCNKLYVLRIGSKEIFNDLVNLGLCPRKSLVITVPKIPERYFEFFLRGYFDGDGCISLEKTMRNRMNIIFTSGSERFLRELMINIESILNSIKSSVLFSGGAFQLRYNWKNAFLIARYIYRDTVSAPYLSYKFEKFTEYKKMRECFLISNKSYAL